MKEKELSLLKYCLPCRVKCCKISKTIGSPIISKDEADRINKIAKDSLIEVVSTTNEKYYIIKEQKGSNKCFFLDKNNKCKIEKCKPLDCLCYPIKAVYVNNKIKFILDKNCPANKFLNNDFKTKAKLIALNSIKRFDKETYNDWLYQYIGWVKKAKEFN